MSDSEKNAAKKAAKKKPDAGSPKGAPSPKPGGKGKKDAAGSPSPELKKKKSAKDETEDQVSTLAEQEGSLSENKSKETLNSPKGAKKGAPKGKADAKGKGKGGKEPGKEAGGKSKGKASKPKDDDEKPKESEDEDEPASSDKPPEKKESCFARYGSCSRPYSCCRFDNRVTRATSPTCFRSCGMQCDSPRMSPCSSRKERATQCACNRSQTSLDKPTFFWEQPRQYTAPSLMRCQSRSPVPRTSGEQSFSCSPPCSRTSCERFRACTSCSCRPDWRPQTLSRPRPRPISSCTYQGGSSYSCPTEPSYCCSCPKPRPACVPRCPSSTCCPPRLPRGLIKDCAPNLSRCAGGACDRNDYSLYNRNYSSPGDLSPRYADRAQWECEARAGLSTTELSPSGMNVVSSTQRPDNTTTSVSRVRDAQASVLDAGSTIAPTSNAGILLSTKSSFRHRDNPSPQSVSAERNESEFRRSLSARSMSQRSYADRLHTSSRPVTPASQQEGWSQGTFHDQPGWGGSDTFHSESNRQLNSRNSQVGINSMYDTDYEPDSVSQRDAALSAKTESRMSKAQDDIDVCYSSHRSGLLNRSQMLQTDPCFSNRCCKVVSSYCQATPLPDSAADSSRLYRDSRDAQTCPRVPASCIQRNVVECGTPIINRSEYSLCANTHTSHSARGQYPTQRCKSFVDRSHHSATEDLSSCAQLKTNQIYSESRAPSQASSNVDSDLEEGFPESVQECDSEFTRLINESGCRTTKRQSEPAYHESQTTTQHCPQVFTNCVCYYDEPQSKTVHNVGGNPRSCYKIVPSRQYRPASNAVTQDSNSVCYRQNSPPKPMDDHWRTMMEPPKSVANIESQFRRSCREGERIEDTSYIRKTPSSQWYNEEAGSYVGSSVRRNNTECQIKTASQTALNTSELKDTSQTRPFYQSAYSSQCNEKPPASISCMSFADLTAGTSRIKSTYKPNSAELVEQECKPLEETKRRTYDYCAPLIPSVAMSRQADGSECVPRCKMVCEYGVPQQDNEQLSRGENQGSKFEVPASCSISSYARMDMTEPENPYTSHVSQQYSEQAKAVGDSGASSQGVYMSDSKLRLTSQQFNGPSSHSVRQSACVGAPELSQGNFVNSYTAANSIQKVEPARSALKPTHASTVYGSRNKLQNERSVSYAQPSFTCLPSQASSRSEIQNVMPGSYTQPSNAYISSQANSRNEIQNVMPGSYTQPSNAYISSQANSRNEIQNVIPGSYTQPSNAYMSSQANSRNEIQNVMPGSYTQPSNACISSQANSRNEIQNVMPCSYTQPSNACISSQANSRNEIQNVMPCSYTQPSNACISSQANSRCEFQNGMSASYNQPHNSCIPNQGASRNKLPNGKVSSCYNKSPSSHLSNQAPKDCYP